VEYVPPSCTIPNFDLAQIPFLLLLMYKDFEIALGDEVEVRVLF
jgi:hypothetical protein